MSALGSPRLRLLAARIALVAALLLGGEAIVPVDAVAAGAGAKKPPPKKTTAKKPPPKKGTAKKPPPKKGKKKKNKKPDGVGPFPKNKYPIPERLRPLVLPNGMGEVGLDLGVGRALETTSASMVASFSYGVADVVDFGVATGLLLAPGVDWNHQLLLQGHYLAYDTKEFDIAPGLVLPILAIDGAPFVAVIDLPSRYVLSDGLFLRFGQGALPITFSPDFGLAIAANGGVGYQITGEAVVFGDLNVLTLTLAPAAHLGGPWETLALSLGGQYTPMKELDVGAVLNLGNTWSADGSFVFGLSLYGRYRF
jgi:hypothetical protein